MFSEKDSFTVLRSRALFDSFAGQAIEIYVLAIDSGVNDPQYLEVHGKFPISYRNRTTAFDGERIRQTARFAKIGLHIRPLRPMTVVQ